MTKYLLNNTRNTIGKSILGLIQKTSKIFQQSFFALPIFVVAVFLFLGGSIAAQSTLIYTQDFSATAPTGWTVVNAGSGNNWNNTFSSSANSYNTSYCMRYAYNYSYSANTWAFTQGVAMTAGKTYRVEFYQKTAGLPEQSPPLLFYLH